MPSCRQNACPMITLTRLTIQRARAERIPQIAGSLTFTTVLSVVPFLAVCFALFTRFPMFKRLEDAIEEHLLRSLLPDEISRTVLRYLAQFATNAGGLTLVGSLFLVVTAVALLLTVENALNQIWKVKKNRPFLKRVGLHLLVIAAGPPLLGVSLWATSYAVSASAGLIETLPPWAKFGLTLGPALIGSIAMAALFHTMPNTRVRKRDAAIGGLIAGIAFELGKRGFAAYVLKLPTYKTVYGSFAAFPVFLLWVYFSWLVTLAAALVTSNLALARKQRAAGKPARA